jgi:TetR/AcrR family transcriptional regulator, mexCD-oprJ operon repressor
VASEPAPRPALQLRVASAILTAAAEVLAAEGLKASMSDVAAAAGVARATVYRYYPNRQALLDELANFALREAEARLTAARIDDVAPEEGVRRAVRALVEAGDPFLALARERVQPDPKEFERRIASPLRRLFERGVAAGVLRADVPTAWLGEALVGLVVGVLAADPPLGREDVVAASTNLFLDGARGR